MSEPEPDQSPQADHQSTSSDSQVGEGDSSATKQPGQPGMRLACIVLVGAVTIAAIAQYFSPQFDHQNANLIGAACIGLAIVYLLFSLYRRDRFLGHPSRVPIMSAVGLVAFFVCFRFEGFSGEMFPLFRWRLSSPVERELQSVEKSIIETPVNAEVDPTQYEHDIDSPQFLGPNRNGVYSRRQFAVPGSISDVEVQWDIGIGAGWSSFAVSAGLAFTLEQRDDQECLTCYRLSDGELMWIRTHEGLHQDLLGGIGPRSTPTINGDFVYATTATGFVWCVQRNTGDVVWTKELFELAGWDQVTFEAAAPWGYSCSPLIVDDICVLTLGGPIDSTQSASLIAFDKHSGELIWKAGEDQLSYASPMMMTIESQPQIVSVNEKSVSAHAIQSGEVLWTFDWPGSSNTGANCAAAVAVGSDQVLVGKGYGGGSALVKISQQDSNWITSDQWRSMRVLKTKFNHTCVAGNIGYGISNGAVQSVNLDDATANWTQPRRSRAAQGQMVLVEDTLVVQDESGDVVFVEASVNGYNELFRMTALDSKTWNIPTVAGRYLLVRNDRQAICFQLPQRQ